MKQTWQPLEQVWQEQGPMGRKRLAKAANCSHRLAQEFLRWKDGKREPPPETRQAQQVKSPHQPTQQPPDPIASRLKAAGITEKELSFILQSAKPPTSSTVKTSHKWGRDSFKFAAIADTHFGHRNSREDWWLRACDLIAQEQCQVVFHAGDITEGMSSRPGHVYELDAVGVNAQVDLAAHRLGMLPCPIEAITGNHDAFAFKVVGIEIGSILAGRLPNYKHLGPDEADVEIDGVTIKLWHGGDGSSYATSYRTQKFVEGLTGGEKPHILLSGHAHKSILHSCRGVMVYEAGTMCGQTSWMRGKKLAAHTGFWIVEVWPSQHGGVERVKSEWVPFF